MTTAIGQFRHVVSLVQPGAGTPDPDGGWGGDAWDPLVPPTWHCSIQAASLRDLQRLSGGVLSTTATHVIRGRYHPQLTRTARIQFGARVFDVESVHDQDERRIEVEVIAHEQLGAQTVEPPPLPYADQVIADGATHYWRLQEPAGTIAVDAIGYAHGTISGGVTLNQPGAIMETNAAMAFAGTGHIVTTVPGVLVPPFSVELWERTTNPDHGLFGSRFPNPTEDSVGFAVVTNTALQCFVTYANGLAANSNHIIQPVSPVADGAWHHLVWVFPAGGTNFHVYVDGVMYPGTPPLNRALIGTTLLPFDIATVSALGSYWQGGLDEIAIYPTALSLAQVAAHYAAATGS